MEFNLPTDRPRRFSHPLLQHIARLGPPSRTYRHCVVRSIFDNDNNYYCHRGELDRKHELAGGGHVCVNIIYYYTDTYTGLQYVYTGTKTGEWPLLHRPPPKLPARVRVGDIWPVKTAQEVNPFDSRALQTLLVRELIGK